MEANPVSATEFNSPKTKNFFTNASGNFIHFHYQYDNFKPAEAVCFFAHGYGGHTDGLNARNMMRYLNEHQVAVFCMDFQGHGYSTGDRAFMISHADMTADLIQFLNVILVDEIETDQTIGNQSGASTSVAASASTAAAAAAAMAASGLPIAVKHFEFGASEVHSKDWILSIRSLPFFMLGQSMGGALLSVCSNTIMDTFGVQYVGTVALAPALAIDRPGWLVVESLRYTMALFNPKGEMTSQKGNNTLDFSNSVRDPAKIAMFEADTWGKPGALGYNRPMRWGTALFFLDLHTHVERTLPSMRFPFLLVHDPEDKVCSIRGSRDMLRLAATAPADKSLVEVPGSLHGLLTNDNDMILGHVLAWVSPRIAAARTKLQG